MPFCFLFSAEVYIATKKLLPGGWIPSELLKVAVVNGLSCVNLTALVLPPLCIVLDA